MAVDQSIPTLVVGDFAVIVRIVRRLLRHLGFTEIDETNDAPAALVRMRTKRYGLVILDWHIKSMQGHDFLRHVRMDRALSSTPIIIMIDKYTSEEVSVAKRAGADNYIVKPFDAPTLKAKIETIFSENAPCRHARIIGAGG